LREHGTLVEERIKVRHNQLEHMDDDFVEVREKEEKELDDVKTSLRIKSRAGEAKREKLETLKNNQD
jgi:hypothetical protein